MLTILIVNYNSAHHTLELIDSLRKSSYKFFKILVLDNASTDGSIEILKHLKTIKLIQNKENTGLTGGVNTAMKHITSKYTLIINPDIVVEEDTLKNLIDFAEDNHVDFEGGVIYNYITKKYSSSGGKINLTTGLASSIKASEPRELEENEYVDACVLLTKTESFKELKYDEKYFMYIETLDLLTRAREQHMRIFTNPNAKVYHKVYGSTGGKKSALTVYYLARNRFLYMKKFAPNYRMFVFLQIPIFIFHFTKYLIKPWLLHSLVKGYYHGLLQK